MAELRIAEAMVAVVDYAISQGAENLAALDGCWESQVDDHWFIAINGHPEETNCSYRTVVPPFSCYIEFNGWPAGMVDPGGGVIAAGELANEDTFIAALKAQTPEEAS